MFDLKIYGGHLIKPFDINSTDRYVRCVAEIGVRSIFVTFVTDENVKISADGKEIKAYESVEIALKENGYGYVTTDIEIVGQKAFTLAILKPAPNNDVLYGLKNRPRFHYTAPYGYINDPNGMIYNAVTGEYHLFYQAYPYSQKAGPKHWGHAVTNDLVTFIEYETALYPDESGDMWSGTAIIDLNNTAKLYDENTSPEGRILLVYYTHSDSVGAGLAYTADGGKSWIKAEGGRHFNFIGASPKHIDPKVFWFKNKWVMFCASGEVFTSSDLWNWTFNGYDRKNECPDIYEIKVEGSYDKKYVRTYGGTNYRVGTLTKNAEFIAETDLIRHNGDSLDRHDEYVKNILKEQGWYTGKTGSFYATQHYMNAPDDRIISVSWLIECGVDVSQTWAGAMSVATEQKLYQKNDGYILYSYPVKELELLHDELIFSCKNTKVSCNSKNILENVFATYADIDGSFILDEGVTEIGFKLRQGADGGDITVKYDVSSKQLIADYSNSKHTAYNGIRSMSMEPPEDRTVSLRILLDSIIAESFGNDGEAYISSVFCRENEGSAMDFYTVGGDVKIKKLTIHTMKSIWE